MTSVTAAATTEHTPLTLLETVKWLPAPSLFRNIRHYRTRFITILETLTLEFSNLEDWLAHPPANATDEDHMMIHTLMAFNRRCLIAAQEGIQFIIERQRHQEERIRTLKEEMRALEAALEGCVALRHDEMAAVDAAVDALDREYFVLTGSSIYDCDAYGESEE